MNLDKLLHATCITGLGAGLFFGALMSLEKKPTPIIRTYQEGIEQGRAEATSNLVSAVNIRTDMSRDSLILRLKGVAENGTLTFEEKKAYLNSAFNTVCQIEAVRADLLKNAGKYAAGEKPSTNQTFQIPEYKVKLNLGEFY